MPIDPNEPAGRRPRASRNANTGFPVGAALAVVALLVIGYFGSRMIAAGSADSSPAAPAYVPFSSIPEESPPSQRRPYQVRVPAANRYEAGLSRHTRLFLSVGRTHGFSPSGGPSDIVGSIARASGLPAHQLYNPDRSDEWNLDGSVIGMISIGLSSTFLEVKADMAQYILSCCSNLQIHGNSVVLRLAKIERSEHLRWVDNAPDGLASSSAAFAKARKLAAEGEKHLADARSADAAGKSDEGRTHRKEAKLAYDTAFTDTAAWEMEILAAYTDKDRQVRDIQRERTRWMDKIIALHKTTGR